MTDSSALRASDERAGETSPQFSLAGRRLLITGAGRGIGRAIAVGAARAGVAVALVARTSRQLDDVARAIDEAGGTAHCLPADLSDLAELPALAVRAGAALGGTLDGVVHAAGVQARGPAVDLQDDEWDRVLRVNLTAPWRLSVEIARRQQVVGKGGSHIFIASMLALTARPDVSPYVASKTGLLGVIRALSTEWAPHGIRVNGVAPGYVETELTAPLFADPAWRAEVLGRVPMGRFGNVDDLVGPTLFLASPASAYMTGHLLTVDGGWTTN